LNRHLLHTDVTGVPSLTEDLGAGRPGEPDADLRWLREAIELSRRCPPSASAFSVGAMLVGSAGSVIATGYSRERDPKDHAEEVALARAADDPLLAGATLYSSLEPCLARASRPRSCVELINESGIGRVVIAWLEPPLFVAGGGAAALRDAGVTVVEIPWLAELARSVNAHLFEESE
jgi:diaminohydroxyphosphoribosylaminopyrimidine deaminase / 5-amino-6-(5-phosphoribosylamino)uracil reductase